MNKTNKMTVFLKALAAGVSIGIGATTYLSCTNRVLGAFMFTVGLFTICFFGLNLYTGKIGYVLEMKHPFECALVWLGNATGCALSGVALRYALPDVASRAASISQNKFNTPLWKLFILGIFCGMLMYIAVENFKKNESYLGKCIGILICVPAFIFCGFEHSIANVVYFAMSVSSMESLADALLASVVVTAANAVGAVIFRKLSMAFKSEKLD